MAMSGPRLLAVALGVTVLVGGVFMLWLHAPFVVSILGAAAFGAVFMLVAASLGNDPAAADAAWRAAAPDLSGAPVDPVAPRPEVVPTAEMVTDDPGHDGESR